MASIPGAGALTATAIAATTPDVSNFSSARDYAAQLYLTPKHHSTGGKAPFRGQARIEQAGGRLKGFKRVALRREKTRPNFGSFVALAAAFIPIKSVHTG